jgi:hypothetical protein
MKEYIDFMPAFFEGVARSKAVGAAWFGLLGGVSLAFAVAIVASTFSFVGAVTGLGTLSIDFRLIKSAS